jgi:hypothetical protein
MPVRACDGDSRRQAVAKWFLMDRPFPALPLLLLLLVGAFAAAVPPLRADDDEASDRKDPFEVGPLGVDALAEPLGVDEAPEALGAFFPFAVSLESLAAVAELGCWEKRNSLSASSTTKFAASSA